MGEAVGNFPDPCRLLPEQEGLSHIRNTTLMLMGGGFSQDPWEGWVVLSQGGRYSLWNSWESLTPSVCSLCVQADPEAGGDPG